MDKFSENFQGGGGSPDIDMVIFENIDIDKAILKISMSISIRQFRIFWLFCHFKKEVDECKQQGPVQFPLLVLIGCPGSGTSGTYASQSGRECW